MTSCLPRLSSLAIVSWIILPYLVCSPAQLVAQTPLYEIVEEIQKCPDNKSTNPAQGPWQIGEIPFQFDSRTELAPTVAPETGLLARVIFEVRAGKPTARLIEPLSTRADEVTDGPYVFWKDATTAEIVTFSKGQVNRRTESNITTPRLINDLDGPETSILLDPTPPSVYPSSLQAPRRLLAISDLEGNYDNARRFLQANGVLDDQGHWIWGDGHLALVGDLVDRGSMVTELMWMMRRLEREAETAGGKVHYILGNHEVMVMTGDLRYIADRYKFVTRRMKIPYNELYSPESDIGRWWRSKHALMKIGDTLFLHAGYSPMLDQFQLDMDTINQRIRSNLPAGLLSQDTNIATNPLVHKHGPLWYRGYFKEHAEEWGGQATAEEISKILKRHQVKRMVIGHTIVPQVGPIDSQGKVICIDVPWKEFDNCQALLIEDDKLWMLDSRGKRNAIQP